MITDFKIFETVDLNKEGFCYVVIKKDNFERFYKKMKLLKLSMSFFEVPDSESSSDDLVCVSKMSQSDKIKNFKSKYYWNFHDSTALYIMRTFNLINPENYKEKWELEKKLKKYNI